MRRLALIILCCLLGATHAHAGTYTVTTTPEEDQALTRMAARETQAIQATSSTKMAPLTPQQMIQRVIGRHMRNTLADMKREAACANITDAKDKATLGCAAPEPKK